MFFGPVGASAVDPGVPASPSADGSRARDVRDVEKLCESSSSVRSGQHGALPLEYVDAFAGYRFRLGGAARAEQHLGEVKSRLTPFDEIVGLVGDRDRLSGEATRLSRVTRESTRSTRCAPPPDQRRSVVLRRQRTRFVRQGCGPLAVTACERHLRGTRQEVGSPCAFPDPPTRVLEAELRTSHRGLPVTDQDLSRAE